MLDIKRRQVKPGRYAIRIRAREQNVTLVDLLAEANKRSGYKVDYKDFTKALDGKKYRPSLDRTLEIIDRILSELELESKYKN